MSPARSDLLEVLIQFRNGARRAQEIEDSLENYPLLDEVDCSDREYEAACEAWEYMSVSERVPLAKKFGFHIMAARRDELPNDERGELVSYLADGC